MSKAAELAALIANVNKGSSLGSKNLIINGAMNVAQRGTSLSLAHDGTEAGYGVDRFYCSSGGNTESIDGTWTQVADVPSGKGFANSLKWTTGTAESALGAEELMFTYQTIEAQNVAGLRYGTSDAKPVTLSFWVKSSLTGTFGSGLYAADGNRILNKTYTISSADTWEYKTITFEGDTSGTINDDNGEGLRPIWHLAAGGNYTSTDRTSWGSYSAATWAFGHAQNGHMTTAGATFFLTGCQLEIGEKATEFEHEPFERTLKKCQRYLETYIVSGTCAVGNSYATNQFIIPFFWSVTKRDTPTFTFPTVGTASGNLGVTTNSGAYPSSHGSVMRSINHTNNWARLYNESGDGYAGFTDDHLCTLYGNGTPVIKIESEL